VHERLERILFAGQQRAGRAVIGKPENRVGAVGQHRIEFHLSMFDAKIEAVLTDLNTQTGIETARRRGIKASCQNIAQLPHWLWGCGQGGTHGQAPIKRLRGREVPTDHPLHASIALAGVHRMVE
jgi:hypothetical protein